MADSVVTFLLQNLTQLLAQESKLLGGVENQVRLLKNELSLINVFLQNTKGKQHGNELVKQVVSQIRDVAYEAEDIIDTFIVTMTKHRRRGKLRKVIHCFDRVIALHEVANKIENIKNVIKEIYDNQSKYGIEIAESSRGDAEVEEILHRRRRYVEVDDVVGFNYDTKALVKHLIEGSSQRNVVSIIGMGGLGKTTLARKIYNNNDVKNYFDVRGWVYVSQEYRIRELLVEILKGVTPRPKLKKFILKAELKDELFHGLEAIYSSNKDKLKGTLIEDLKVIEEMSDEECKKTLSEVLMLKNAEERIQDHITKISQDQKLNKLLLRFVKDIYKRNGDGWQDLNDDELKSGLFECLKDKRYLIVMDDIWKTELWNEVSTIFCDDLNGSRVLITSRIKEVALHASSLNSIPPIPPYELPFLKEDNSWELFSKKVFRGATCPPELETLGRKIVKTCHGLPLAIVVLGGLLANKEKTHRTWSKYAGHVNSYLTEDRSSCIDILALSYNHLPQCLKPFFLYFGIYPEDFEIPVRQLFRLWIAEGFIRQVGNRNMEDVAEDYLEELIDRSLIQVATKRLDGGVKTCRIHDLLRDLCISESAEEKFLEVRSDVNLSAISISRRISIHHANQPYISSSPCKPSNSRSIIGFGGVVELESPPDNCYLEWICKSNKLVRVVELSNMGICCLIPDRIENLILLRYLSIRSGELHVIPDSVCKLCNLETLDMRDSIIRRLPRGIWKLQKLRHLYLNGRTSLPITDNDAALPNIQVLTGIAVNQDIENLFAKGRFPNVRKLGLYSSRALESKLLSSLHPLCHLQTLKIYFDLFEVSSPISFYSTLTKITLLCASLSPASLGVLGSLTNLRILKVRGVMDVRFQFTLDCNESSFHQLEVFKIEKVDVLQWTMEKGAMPSLQRLVIEGCDFHIMPPRELWCLTALRDVEVLYPSQKLAKMLQKLRTRDGCKLHVYPPN
ncbi:toMV susceptible protein tm-2-like [Quercus suber]|uniref:toMV susceptible protein tm-2-like n=1 Tax=Quercus suber TaxID=58331 RepID=UPI000CE27BB2|nr:late blight resistance protein R1-A-like [Quercus suber]